MNNTKSVVNLESAQSEAMRFLKDALNIDLKTDLEDTNEVKLHATLQTLNTALEWGEEDFKSRSILRELIQNKEIKAVNKRRMSRAEIVEMVRGRDINQTMQTINPPQEKKGFKKWFTPKKRE